MANPSVAERVRELAEPVAAEQGCELLEVKFLKEGSRWILRLVIDKRGGIFIEDCENVSRAVDPLIDERVEIPQAYYLEVQSPGLDRPLKTQADFQRYIGHELELSFYQARDGVKKLVAVLVDSDEEVLTVQTGSAEQRIALAEIANAKRVIHF
ncbi:MAG: ribosome maturation factor RimP [Clostridiaceae bacterium]|nr:ribosome maturation factor RimP [Clostridiaceae bacterium]